MCKVAWFEHEKVVELYTLISLINVGLQITVGSGKKYLILINEGSGTNVGPGIFVMLYKEAFEMATFFDFHPIFPWFFSKINKRRVFNNCVGPGIFSQKE